ncbi:MAG: NAD-dependent epimerase/dehydratase family protein [Verrucomicrobiota bacterium]
MADLATMIREVVRPLPHHDALRDALTGKRTLILGADGFLGSYTAIALQDLGAHVSLLQRRPEPRIGRNHFEIFQGDLSDTDLLQHAITDCEIIFDFVGSSSAIDTPSEITALNALHTNAYQAAARLNPPPLVVLSSSRTVYGKPQSLPVNESHPLAPQSPYAHHKIALETQLAELQQTHNLPFIVVRLSNIYGPFPVDHAKSYGILNQFIDTARQNGTVRLFGDGAQLRDYLFIRDAVAAFLHLAANPDARNRIINLGGPEPISIRAAADELLTQCPGASLTTTPWPPEHQAVETGDYTTDLTLLHSLIPPIPFTPIPKGIQKTLHHLTQT